MTCRTTLPRQATSHSGHGQRAISTNCSAVSVCLRPVSADVSNNSRSSVMVPCVCARVPGTGRDTHVWQAFLYDIKADRAETTDLWGLHRTIAKQMLARFLKWQASVFASQQADEIGTK